MAVLILSKPMPPEPFAAELAARHFGHPVHTSIDAVDPAAVRWLIAWRLPEGLLPTLPNLELLFCCAAGVDKLVSVRDLPPTLPVSRVVDDSQALELAQYVVHAVLDHLRGAPRYRAQQTARQWTRHRALTVGRRVKAAAAAELLPPPHRVAPPPPPPLVGLAADAAAAAAIMV